MRILVVEDDEHIKEMLVATLTEQNYAVDVATDGLAGWELAEAFTYDLILLDVMLPKLDGISFCRQLRSQKKSVPVLLLTARDTSTDKMIGLDAGADDYVVKPFNLQELAARIRALLRRGSVTTSPVLEWGQLRLDPSTCEVTYGNQPINFTRKEYSLLELFLRNNRRVFSRSAILDHLWSFDEPPGEETVKAHIKGLRHKLKPVGAEDLIETLYGQGYRLNPTYLSEKSSKPQAAKSEVPSQQATTAIVAKIWERTKGASLDRVSLVEQAASDLIQGTLDEELRQKAEQNAHKLLGSLGTFGLAEGSRLAQKLEQIFQPGITLDAVSARQVKKWVKALRQEVEGKGDASANQESEATRSSQTNIPAITPNQQPLLLIVNAEPEIVSALVTEAATWKLRTEIAPNVVTARQLANQLRPDVVLLDLSLGDVNPDHSLVLLQELTAQVPSIPVIVFTERSQFTDRVKVARLGGRAFLQKPTSPAQALQVVTQVLQRSRSVDAKIMTVDDDPQILMALKGILEPWGFQLTSLENPLQFWDTLQAVQPDLLMLDIQLPNISGIELCQALRNDPRWDQLPVLVLTAQTDAETRHQVFAVGADDYVTKPIAPAELVTRILNRLERTRLLRSQAEIDPLVGVANRQRSTHDLEQLLQLAKHSHQPVCLAVLDLDHLKQINNQYGYAAGDMVLRQTGQLLKQKFRPEDVVARWGGEEFVVGMYGMTQPDGVEWLAEALETLRTTAFTAANGASFHITFSAGVSQYPVDGTDLQMLYRTADAALYEAKMAGGDRVLPAGWQPLAEPVTSIDVALVYTDSEFAAQVLKALATRGYHTQWFKNGAEALSLLEGPKASLRATVILLGEQLPGLEGLDVLKRLEVKKLRQSRIIWIPTQLGQAEAALKLGAFDYIIPPCSIPVLMQRLRRAWES